MSGPNYPPGPLVPFNYWSTIISQYANSNILTTLIGDFFQWLDQTTDFNNFYDLMWNVATAQGYGLDVWGRIVGVTRVVNVATAGKYLGFDEATTLSADPFNQSPFFVGTPLTTNFSLTDSAFRTLIYAKALANICDGSIPAMNALLRNLFPGRGNCFSGDTEILTEDGFVSLRSLSGSDVSILSPVSGSFEIAKAKSYGIQSLNKITISNSCRKTASHGSFIRRATKDHKWVLQDGSITNHLRVGHVLKAGYSDLELDIVGWVHGFIFGDGSADRPGNFRVRLCSKKAKHLRRIIRAFPNATFTYPQHAYPDPIVRLKSNDNLKGFPDDSKGPDYIGSFVKGLIAADGCFFNRDDDPFQFHGNEACVTWIRDRLILANYAPCGRAYECDARPTNYGERSEPLWKQHFRKTDNHKGFKVVNIEPDGEEEVFCVEESLYKQLVMRDGLRSHNCYVIDNNNMTMIWAFHFTLSAVELAILGQSGVLPKPVGVSAVVAQV